MTSKEKIEKAWELVNNKRIETNEEIQLVRYAVRRAYELEERVTPRKVKIETSNIWKSSCTIGFRFPICPNCKIELNEFYKNANKFCKECGQRLDWSDENE